ncbi:MAG: DUF4126 domain-containing protein [Bacteroidales bacterium]|nr:DUF4126 domain-containing protein [Bacteroidales bacterium]
MEKEIITAIALGIGLSASAGFRVFIPMLVASIAACGGNRYIAAFIGCACSDCHCCNSADRFYPAKV